jgi:3-dehydroquinate synthase
VTESIHIGPDALQQLSQFLQNRAFSQVVVLADDNTVRLCYPQVEPFLPQHALIRVPSGEETKNLQTSAYIWEEMTRLKLDRWALLLNLGGGVVGDMGGFCSAVYKRGINFIQVPTTLLAQVDASVGGKTGIDFLHFKNHLGVFQEPLAVFIYPPFLDSLPQGQLRSGYAEIIKHWLIADAKGWATQRQAGLLVQDWVTVVGESVAIKAAVVEADPLENGYRKVLNFGHTVGHAVESFLLPLEGRALLHGEAVAVGMLCESWLSVQKGLLSQQAFEEIEVFLSWIYEKVDLKKEEISPIAQLCLQDKKNTGSTINCTLLEEIGKAVYNQPVTLQEIEASLRYYIR